MKPVKTCRAAEEGMPFIGLGVHVLPALFFAVHAIRTGRNLYWLIILFSFPLLGSIVYFLVELPQSRLNRGINKAAGAAMKLLDPERWLTLVFPARRRVMVPETKNRPP
jgi:hypothetical protein